MIRTLSSLFEVPSSALAAEFSTGYEQRSVLLSYRFFFGWVGGLTVNYLAYAVFLTPDATHRVGQLNPAGYAHYGMAAGAIIFIAILISAIGTHRHIPHLMPPPPRRHLTLARTLGEMRETLSNRSFLFLLVSSIAGAMAAGMAASLNIYFNTYFWEFTVQADLLPDAGRLPLGGDRADRRADALAPLRQAHRHPADAGAVGDHRASRR